MSYKNSLAACCCTPFSGLHHIYLAGTNKQQATQYALLRLLINGIACN